MDLAELRSSLQTLLATSEPLQHELGQAGKEITLEELSRSIGSDRVMSGFKRPVTLNAGYDLGNPVVLNLRPGGLWILVDEGRKRTSRIIPKGRGKARKRAITTPQGPRAFAMSRPSRGLRAIERSVNRMVTTDELPNAVVRGLDTLIEKGL